VSKPQAKAAAVKKAPAKSAKNTKPAAAKSAVKLVAKAASKPAAKPASRPVSKPAPKPVSKPAHKPVPKPAASKKTAPSKPAAPAKKAAAPVHPKPPNKPAVKPVSPAAAASPPSKTAAPAKAAASAPAAGSAPSPAKSKPMTATPTELTPVVAKPVATKPAKPGKISAAKAAQLAVAPASPPSNRFTDRFAPARPHIRQMAELAEQPKINYRADPKLAAAWKTKAGRELSEPELHAMPEAEYMNDKQLDFFRARLQKQRDDLLSNAGETTEHLREDTSIVPDPADRATIEEEHALELRTRDRERKLLKKIAQSLGRLESGDYGFCDETGEPIGLARLIARPTATLSLEAQQRRELKQKMFGD
jgi:DnaK suppressor protein